MRKIIGAVLTTLTGLVLLFSYRTSLGSSADVGAAPETAAPPASAPTSAPSGVPTPSSTRSGTPTATSAPGLVDGSYAGRSVSTRYGAVQVTVTVSGGAITAIDVPQYPSGNARDTAINERAIPVLVSRALAAQRAAIDMVSGATYTSAGYRQSLQSAIDEATR